MRRGGPMDPHRSSIEDLDRELALLRRKRELLEGQQHLLHRENNDNIRGQRQHPISPWNSGVMLDTMSTSSHYGNSNFGPERSYGRFDYSAMYNDAGPSQRPEPRKRSYNSNQEWDRPPVQSKRAKPPARGNFGSARQQPRNPQPPRPERTYRPPPQPAHRSPRPIHPQQKVSKPKQQNEPPNKLNTYPREQRKKLVATAVSDINYILPANATDIPPKVKGRMEMALGAILMDMKRAFPERAAVFKQPYWCKLMKQTIRDRIKEVLTDKVVGSVLDIRQLYRAKFPDDDDLTIVEKVDSLILDSEKELASGLDVTKKEGVGKSAVSVAPVAQVDGGKSVQPDTRSKKPPFWANTVAAKADNKQQQRAETVRFSEADVILKYFKDNMFWALDCEVNIMLNNIQRLYSVNNNIEYNAIIKEIITSLRQKCGNKNVYDAICERENLINIPLQDIKEVDETTKETCEGNKDIEVNKDTNGVNKDTSEGNKDTEVNKDTNEVNKDTSEGNKDTNEVNKDTSEGNKDTSEVNKETSEVNKETSEVNKETNEGNKDMEEGNKDTDEKTETIEENDDEELTEMDIAIQKIREICLSWLGKHFYYHMPRIIRKHSKAICQIVQKSLMNRMNVAEGQEEVMPARKANTTKKMFVSLVGRPKLPKRQKLGPFLSQYNPVSIKRHKNIFNLLFVGFDDEKNYNAICKKYEYEIGSIKLHVKPVKSKMSPQEYAAMTCNEASVAGESTGNFTDDLPIENMIDNFLDSMKKDGDDDVIDVTPKQSVIVLDDSEKVADTSAKVADTSAKVADVSTKVADKSAEADTKDDMPMESILDNAIVLDSIGCDDDDDIKLDEDPPNGTDITVEVDLDETVLLNENANDKATADEIPNAGNTEEKVANPGNTEGKVANAGNTEGKVANASNTAKDEKIENTVAKEGNIVNTDKAVGVATRRSSRLNNA